MFARNVAKLGLAALSALIMTAGPSIARADDSAAERAFQLEWFKYQMQLTDGFNGGPPPTRESIMRSKEAKDSKGAHGAADTPVAESVDKPRRSNFPGLGEYGQLLTPDGIPMSAP
jgi:hypothetical protein